MIRRPSGLSRKLAVRMAIAAVGGVAITVAGLVVFYGLVLGRPVFMAGHDYVAILAFCVLGTLFGILAAQSLARQIISPVRSIAAAARKIAEHDLSARAVEPDDTLGEVRDLARDFNLMAERLMRLAIERKQWRESASHELRTPLMILRGQLQGGLDGIYPLDPQLLKLALAQVEALARTVGDLKAMENTEGHVFFAWEDAPLDDVLRDLKGLFETPLRQAGLDVEWRIEPVPARFDRTRVHQAVTALLENLRVHASPGPARVSLVQDGECAVISVADAGPGVASAMADRIFEPFKRGQSLANGSGVGLAVARWHAEGHGGIARLQSSDLGGSDFQIILPLRPVRGAGLASPTA